jgi:hypothetical protein
MNADIMNPYFPVCFKTPENTVPLEMRSRILLGRRKSKMAPVESTLNSLESKLLARVADITISCETWGQDESDAIDKSTEDSPYLHTPKTPLFSMASTVAGDVHVTPLVSNGRFLKRTMDNVPYLPEETGTVYNTPAMKRRRGLLLARERENTCEFPFFPCLSPRDRVVPSQRPLMPILLG